ncbi:putative PAS/PAC sensor protein [Syntrophobacter sp. SbD2]|nr:putative PAS/PAC sensor protein [Syntrophobacter sp. SbD2]
MPTSRPPKKISPKGDAKKDFPIVGIGASAGGLEALEAFLAPMPLDTGMAFVVIQHLSPKHKSLMAEILQRITPMKVTQIEDGMRIEPNRVYLNVPDKETALFNSVFQLTDPASREGFRLPIDYFFRSLAEDHAERAVCVILSGTGSDGTLGLKAIKGKGGMSMAQEEHQAKYAGMPQSAIETGLVDLVLPVEKMSKELIAYVKHPYVKNRGKSNRIVADTTTAFFQKILMLIRSSAGADFTHYKRTTVSRRIERRMAVHQLDHIGTYFRFLTERPAEVQVLFKDLLIGVTSFFRDPQAFEILATRVIPRLLEQKQGDAPLRIWVPGCSTGEEAVSIAILMEEAVSKSNRHSDVQIFATDLDPDAIEYARAGKYTGNIVADVPAGLLEKYFVKEENKGYRTSKKIRATIVYALQNLIADPPFSKLDLISCRNLLIYLDTSLQQKIFPIFYYALNQDGYLFLGSSESIGKFGDLFSPVDSRWNIYERKDSIVQRSSTPRLPPPQFVALLADWVERKSTQGEIDIRELAEKRIIAQYSPPCVFLDDHYNILYFQGSTGKYLVQPSGKPTLNILKMARRELQAKLASALSKAVRQQTRVVCEGVQIAPDDNSGIFSVDVIVQLVREPGVKQELIMVSFEEKSHPGKIANGNTAPEESSDTDPRILILENELQATKEYLRVTIEELQTTNEELRSTNEEMQSANEELTSTNEELETSREELVNMNSQLQGKVIQLSELSNDVENLYSSTAIGTVFLDTRLNIRRFTPALTDIFNLIPSDVGRPISDITSKLADYDLTASVRSVLKTLQHSEAEVQNKEGTWFSIRTLPYRTVENVIDGVVVSFVDITALKEVEKLAADARAFAETITDTIREALLVLDGNLKVVSANKVFYRNFQITREKTEGGQIFSLGNGQWDIPRLRELLEKIIPEKSSFDDFEVEHDFPNIGHRKMVLNARMMKQQSGKPSLVLLAMEDITDRGHHGR